MVQSLALQIDSDRDEAGTSQPIPASDGSLLLIQTQRERGVKGQR